MIQRIQTVWLGLVILLSVASFFFPYATFQFDYKMMNYSETFGMLAPNMGEAYIPLVQKTHMWSMIFMQAGVALIALAAIFMYKKRPLQVKITAAGMLMAAVFISYVLFFKIDGIEKYITQYLATPKVSYGISCYFTLLQLLLFILAQRVIKKDERLVRSTDRLR